MALYCYVKKQPKYRVIKQNPVRKHNKASGGKMFLSTMLAVTGLFMIGWVSYPIVSFELTSNIRFNKSADIASSDNRQSKTDNPVKQKPSVLSAEAYAKEGVSDPTQIDYTQINNWFPNAPQSEMSLRGRTYYMSIPKLKIKDALVTIAGDDLNTTLIHYGGTGLPGDYGTAVIFGHSILPQFYNPTNYKTIFSLLPSLKEKDEIFVKYDGVTYRYVVSQMRVTTPNDITVLEQRYDSSYISLITCVPPGTYWKRLEVKAKLEAI